MYELMVDVFDFLLDELILDGQSVGLHLVVTRHGRIEAHVVLAKCFFPSVQLQSDLG